MWPEPQETQELLRQAGDGRSGAIDALLARHREGLRRVVSLRLDPLLLRRIDASDIVQEVLFDAHRRLAEYLLHPAIPFHLWLRKLARDRMIDAHRRHRVARRRTVERERSLDAGGATDHSSATLLGVLAAGSWTPAANAMRHELEQSFATALESLREEDREVLLMRHFEQIDNQEVARTLGITEPAASMRHLRALRRLREVLERHGHVDGKGSS